MLAPSPQAAQRRAGLIGLGVATIGWGLNWPALKLLLHEWPPLFARGSAGVTAGILLALYARSRGESLSVPRGAWLRLGWAAFTNVFAWMGFSSMAMVWLSVSEGALLIYTMPVWAMLLAWPILGARPTTRLLLALTLSFSGVALLFGGHGLHMSGGEARGIPLALSAAILFALGTVTQRKPLPLTPVAMTAWQVGLGCLPMLVAGLLFEHPDLAALTLRGFALWLYMCLVPMGFCYLGWFAAVRGLASSTAATGTLLVPLVGVLSAAPILGEPLGLIQIVALLVTLCGVALVVSAPRTV